MTMLTEQAHLITWCIYLAGVATGLLVLGHFLVLIKRPFVRVLSRALYLGLLLAPVAIDTERMFFAPAIMQVSLSAMAGKMEPMQQALISLVGMTLLALIIGVIYYLKVFFTQRKA